jgi:1,4-alpha-glucan branching enzyme
MAELAKRRRARPSRAALNQAREILLLQSSDWAFIMDTGAVAPYAHKRFKVTVRFTRLASRGTIDEGFLGDCEWKDSICQKMDYGVIRS